MTEQTATSHTILRDSLFVAAGGALGTLLRFVLNFTTQASEFPVGTIIENITGAFLLGIVVGVVAATERAPHWLKTGVGVGFCGSYTTMSTFAADTFIVTAYQTPMLAMLYVGVSLIFGLLLARIGIGIGKYYGGRL